VFTDQNGVWQHQGGKLSGGQASSCGLQYGSFGTGVALSGDGNMALVGGGANHDCTGSAWIFTRAGSAWSAQATELMPSDRNTGAEFGWSVALAPDGDHALIGGYNDGSTAGAAWLFTRSGEIWAQDGSKLVAASPGGQLGYAVALSADAETILAGANGALSNQGEAWVFAVPPIVTALSPATGPATGGTPVTITGTNLQNVTAVHFGSAAATIVKSLSSTEATATSPAGAPGPVDVTVTTHRGTSASTAAAQFIYQQGPPRPTLSHVRQSHRRWRIGRKLARLSAARRVPIGTTFSFTLNAAATVSLRFTAGRRHRAFGTVKLAARQGHDRIAFGGRFSRRRKLRPGGYTVTLTATDRTGRSSKPTRLKFTVTPG
jgi:hypothetical protein